MNEQERAQAYLHELELLGQKYGCRIVPRLVMDVSGALGTVKAVADVTPIPNWQPVAPEGDTDA